MTRNKNAQRDPLAGSSTASASRSEHLAPLGDLDELVADALADHDPENRLGATSATLTELALYEPSMADGTRTLSPITDAEVADGMTIPERVARECLGE